MEKEIYCECTDNLVCPYCGHEEEPYEITKDINGDGIGDECYSCGKQFQFESDVSRTFRSWKVACLNGSEHTWKSMGIAEYPNARYCRECWKREWNETRLERI